MTDAACQGLPTGMFFPANEDGPAKAVCAQRPVRRQCVAYALAEPAWRESGERPPTTSAGDRRRQLRHAG
ncbi:MAG: WhiB family transcriptional regulator [Solirubrobacterales bacterium]